MRVLKQISTDKILAWMSDATDGTLTANERAVPSNDLLELDMPSDQLRKAWRKQEEANLTYADKRKSEYPTIEELVVALYDPEDKAEIDRRRAEVKNKYPKETS